MYTAVIAKRLKEERKKTLGEDNILSDSWKRHPTYRCPEIPRSNAKSSYVDGAFLHRWNVQIQGGESRGVFAPVKTNFCRVITLSPEGPPQSFPTEKIIQKGAQKSVSGILNLSHVLINLSQKSN